MVPDETYMLRFGGAASSHGCAVVVRGNIMTRKSFLLLSVALSFAMVAPAQQGGGGGRGGGGGGTTGGTTAGNTRPGGQGGQGGNQPGGRGNQNDPFGQQNDPFGQQRQRQQQRRPIYLSGQVLLDDGNPPSEPVTIQRICNGQNVPETYTDHKGRFSFELGGNAGLAMADASSSGSSGLPGGGPGGAFGGGQAGGLGGFGAGNSTGVGQVDLSACELVGELPGYRSDRVQLGRRSVFDRPDVGVIVMHRLGGVRGDSVSITTLAAPKNAKKAYQSAMKELRKKDARQRKPEKAVANLEKAVAEYPKYAAAWTLLGQTKMNMNDPGGARDAFHMAMQADPKYMKPYAPLLQLEVKESNWDQVSELSAILLKLNPNLTDVKYFQSVANYNLGKFDEAEMAIDAVQSSKDASRFPQTFQILGLIQSKKGDFTKAATSYRSFVEAQPGSPAATKVKGLLMEWEALGVIQKPDSEVAAK